VAHAAGDGPERLAEGLVVGSLHVEYRSSDFCCSLIVR
jgi:hypothetical protein